MAKMTICNSCGAEIASSAKSCPHCGAKVKKPIFKRVWFWILIVLVVGGIAAAGSGGSDKSSTETATSETSGQQEQEKIEYTPVSVEELLEALDENAAAASDQYKGQYVEVTGRLSNIDSSGDYISLSVLDENDWEHMFSDVQCFIKSDQQLETVKSLKKGDTIAVRGKITDVGEILGYSLDIDRIAAGK